MHWTKDEIVKAVKKLYAQGRDLSYNAMASRQQALVSAAAYHFGSYRTAVEKAGVDYAEVTRRPRWTRQKIIALIKAARRKDDDLHWSAVTKRRDELGRAAFASLQPRLFGSWDRALTASGLDADDVNRYRKWDREHILFELKGRYKGHEPLNSGAIQRDDPGLHAASVRHFGSYDAALKAAKIDPVKVRERKRWDKAEVIKSIKAAKRSGKKLSDSSIRKEEPALYGAAVRLFGSFTLARTAAGVKFVR
ncbi:hypothetical protein [Humisphaera borealis]|uniref:Uncharacterized protein n=1 Tax=Humisphaera borealis TaxID=2807512 RepID=A0A7M2X1L7_9BACT|nr:hypothetical protein [Humisphaera borealis]QOV91499.1 hypothetical protein IPV69_09135 [Humisphaera borealis]